MKQIFGKSAILIAVLLVLGSMTLGSCYNYELEVPEITFAIPDDDDDLLDLIEEYENVIVPNYLEVLAYAYADAAANPTNTDKIAAFFAAQAKWDNATAQLAELEAEAYKRGLFADPTPAQKVLQDAVLAAWAKAKTVQAEVDAATAKRDATAANKKTAEDARKYWEDNPVDPSAGMAYTIYVATGTTLANAVTAAATAATAAATERSQWMAIQTQVNAEVTAAEAACKASGARLPKKP